MSLDPFFVPDYLSCRQSNTDQSCELTVVKVEQIQDGRIAPNGISDML